MFRNPKLDQLLIPSVSHCPPLQTVTCLPIRAGRSILLLLPTLLMVLEVLLQKRQQVPMMILF